MQRRTWIAGFCLLVWKGDHVAEPTELAPQSASGYWNDLLAVGRAIDTCFHPVKVNCMVLGNTIPHFHTNVIPRYLDDPAPGGPIPWELLVSAPPVDDAKLRSSVEDLRRALQT